MAGTSGFGYTLPSGPCPRHGHETTALFVVPGQGQKLAGDISDLPAHNLAHAKQGANSLL